MHHTSCRRYQFHLAVAGALLSIIAHSLAFAQDETESYVGLYTDIHPNVIDYWEAEVFGHEHMGVPVAIPFVVRTLDNPLDTSGQVMNAAPWFVISSTGLTSQIVVPDAEKWRAAEFYANCDPDSWGCSESPEILILESLVPAVREIYRHNRETGEDKTDFLMEGFVFPDYRDGERVNEWKFAGTYILAGTASLMDRLPRTGEPAWAVLNWPISTSDYPIAHFTTPGNTIQGSR